MSIFISFDLEEFDLVRILIVTKSVVEQAEKTVQISSYKVARFSISPCLIFFLTECDEK